MQNYTLDLELNPQQLEAVLHTDGPLLVLAGAGTGKTRVLTARVAHIIKSGLAMPHEILAVTFTNKAAREIVERISDLCENSHAASAGTFHSIAARILRQHAHLVGLTSNYNIADTDDQLKIIKNTLLELGIDDKETPPKLILSIISRWKDMGLSFSQISNSDLKTDGHILAKKIYAIYQDKLLRSNLCDFGDLLLYNTIIFFENPNILDGFQAQYKYILIDEYQDTNPVQYLWARMLADKHKNICCVGDDDQSIYSWRGAEVGNILRFEKDFTGAKIVALEENYRSTTTILKAASSLIKNNNHRHTKTLWSKADGGEQIRVVSCYNDKEEAKFISNNIYSLLGSNDVKAQDIAILVRAGFQTRAFEEAFINSGIQYKIIGGLKFYERAEIKDILAYLRLVINDNDDVAFERIINTPKRAIGPSTLLSIKNHASSGDISYLVATELMIQQNIFKPKVAESIRGFVALIRKYQKEIAIAHSPSDIVKNMISDSGYRDMLKIEKSEESRARLDNLNELVRAIGEYESLQEFIQHTSLITDNESMAHQSDQVNIMTIHASKGLEFNTVFIPGMEEGLFPHQKSLSEEGTKGLEEERRIAYVGMTRAKKHLFLLYAETRRIFHEFVQSIPSRFLSELPNEIVTKTSSTSYYSPHTHKYKTYSNNYANSSHVIKEDKIDGLRPGSRITHQSFGNGIILKKNGDNLEIFFDKSGIKTIKEAFVSLQ